ncbi:MAG: hypothetical protein ACLQPD_32450 [Desulfomonilaceae bacterium]
MRTIRLGLFTILTSTLFLSVYSLSIAGDYNPRFVHNYPPGYYGMWYYAQRFQETDKPRDPLAIERYRWDRYMGRITELSFPYYPIPYEWDYGTDPNRSLIHTYRSFNLPDYNTNDWW